MQEKIEELRAMFPELSVTEVKELLNAHGGDLMQIVDKLLLQPSPPKSSSTTSVSRTQEQTASTPGNPASSAIGSASISTNPIPTHQSSTSISNLSSKGAPASPWGMTDSAQNVKPIPSAFVSQRESIPLRPLEESYSLPLTSMSHPILEAETHAEPKSAPQESSPPKPLLRSISPPKSRIAPALSSPKAIPRPEDHPNHIVANSTGSQDSFQPSSVSSMPASLVPSVIEPSIVPIDNLESHTLLTVERPSKSQLLLVHPTPFTPTTPSREASLGPLTVTSPWSTTSASPSSQMSSSLSSSRINDERNARLRAAEAQFQMLMASMSEMDNQQQQELDRQEARIHQLEAELAALTAEKTTWVGRLQMVSSTSVQLREQISRQNTTIEQLTEQLQARDKLIADLNAKVASFQPIQEAEDIRAKFESTLRQQTSQHQGEDLHRAMELFAATFQQALAASLMSTAPSNQRSQQN